MNVKNFITELPKNTITTKEEIRRLEKAARDKDRKKLWEWAKQFENQIKKEYEDVFEEDLGNSIDIMCLALAYTLTFNEKTKFGVDRLTDFLDDFFVTVDMFSTGEYSPEDYAKQLEKKGIYFEHIKDLRKGEDNEGKNIKNE